MYLGTVDRFIEIQYRLKSTFAFNMCIALMLRHASSQTNIKIDINCVIDFQNIPKHINNKELGIFIFESYIFVY